MKTLLISLDGALTRLELFPGEIFNTTQYNFIGLSSQEYIDHPQDWHQYHCRICVLNFSFGMHPTLDLSPFDIVFVLNEESIDGDPNDYQQRMTSKFKNQRMFFIASSYDQQYVLDNQHFYLLPFFCLSVARHNDLPSRLDQSHRDRLFDVLLGMQKTHRDWLFYQIARHDLLPQCLVNYTTSRWHDTILRTIYRSPELNDMDSHDWLPQGVFDSYASLHNRGSVLSQLVPWKVYTHSWYSVVAETEYISHCFISEKTAKCFLAGRIFVLFAGYGLLEHCRQLGFRTFDMVLDETYDEIQDPQQRWQAAFEQVIWLSKQKNHCRIHTQLQAVLAHNQSHIRNRHYFTEPLQSWIQQKIRDL